MKTWAVSFLLLLLIISKIRCESHSSNVGLWEGGEDQMEEIGEEWWVDEEVGIKMWTEERSGKVPVNVESFGAVGDGVADDTQVGTVIINLIGSSLHFNSMNKNTLMLYVILTLRRSNSDVYGLLLCTGYLYFYRPKKKKMVKQRLIYFYIFYDTQVHYKNIK
jgi:hypothetical protein